MILYSFPILFYRGLWIAVHYLKFNKSYVTLADKTYLENGNRVIAFKGLIYGGRGRRNRLKSQKFACGTSSEYSCWSMLTNVTAKCRALNALVRVIVTSVSRISQSVSSPFPNSRHSWMSMKNSDLIALAQFWNVIRLYNMQVFCIYIYIYIGNFMGKLHGGNLLVL